MAKINSYPFDSAIQDDDAWIGSDSISKQTKQYTAEAVATYTIGGLISGSTVNTLSMFSGTGLVDSQLKQVGPGVNGTYQMKFENADRFIIDKPSSVTSGDPEYLITQDGNAKVSMGWDDDGQGFGFLYNWAGDGWRFGSAGNNPELTIVTTAGQEGVTVANNLIVDGKVGIGTSGINPADKLHVQGTVRAVVAGSSGAAFNAINAFGVSSTFRFENNHAVLALKNNSNVVATKISSDGFSWFDGGSVGFGTTTPASPVEMVIPDTSSTSRGGLLLSEAGDSSTLDSVRVEYKSNKSGSGNPGLIFTPRSQPSSGVWETFFRFKTNGGELVGNKANLTVDGKVGIGTTNDSFASRLTVAKGDIEVTEYEKGLILRSTNGTRYRLVVADDGTLTTTAV